MYFGISRNSKKVISLNGTIEKGFIEKLSCELDSEYDNQKEVSESYM